MGMGTYTMSNQLTERELTNIFKTYENYGEAYLGDFIRAIWKEAYDEGEDAGFKRGVVEGFNRHKIERA